MSSLLSSGIIAQRVFSPVYIILDSVFIVAFLAALIARKRFMTALFAVFGGVLYMIVDYGIFHLALHTRSIENGDLFWVLLWMSMSYGITNFALIWIWLGKDEHYKEYTAAIWIWWICSYHGFMALFMVISYFAVIVYNLIQKDKDKRFNIVWLFVLGVLAQLGWEAGLLIGGIRSADFDPFTKIMTLITNSLVETNLGMPAIYCIFLLLTARFTENLKKRDLKVSFAERLKESNLARYPKRAKQ